MTDANSIVEHTTTSFGYRFTASQDTTVTADTESTFHWVQVDSVTDATALDLRANVTTRCGCDLITNADGIIALGNVTQDFATNQLVVSFIASSLCASSYSVQQVKADGQPTRLTPLKTPAAVSSLECESKMAVTQYILGSEYRLASDPFERTV